MSILSIIDELKANGSTLKKKEILNSHKDNDVLRLVFTMTENPRYNFYIRLEKNIFQDEMNGPGALTVPLLKNVLDTLHGRRLTGHAARDWLHGILKSLNHDDRQVLNRIINRDMDCKVGTSLINATWPGSIPTINIMLADKFNAKTVSNLVEDSDKPKIITQTKFDGGRVNAVINEDSLDSFSRGGNLLALHGVFDHLASKELAGWVFDGELICVDKFGKFLDRKTSNGIFNKAVKGTITPEEAKSFRMVVWDCFPVENYRSGETYKVRYEDRLKKVQEMVSKMDNIWIAQSTYCRTLDEVQEQYALARARKEEGIIVKSTEMFWEEGRSKFQLKMKAELDCTLLCVSFKPHSKFPGQIGSLECVSSDGEIEVSVGSGLDEEDRKKDPSEFIGKLIDIKYNELIKARGAKKYSLYLGIYSGIRLDQKKADDLSKFM